MLSKLRIFFQGNFKSELNISVPESHSCHIVPISNKRLEIVTVTTSSSSKGEI